MKHQIFEWRMQRLISNHIFEEQELGQKLKQPSGVLVTVSGGDRVLGFINNLVKDDTPRTRTIKMTTWTHWSSHLATISSLKWERVQIRKQSSTTSFTLDKMMMKYWMDRRNYDQSELHLKLHNSTGGLTNRKMLCMELFSSKYQEIAVYKVAFQQPCFKIGFSRCQLFYCDGFFSRINA